MATRDEFHIAYTSRASVLHASEGLNVLLSDLIKPLADDDVHVTIHTTERHRRSVHSALLSNGVTESQVTVKSHRVGSMLLNILGRSKQDRQRSKGRSLVGRLLRLTRSSLGSLEQVGAWALDLTLLNSIFKLPLLAVLGLFALLVVLVTIPITLIIGLLGFFGLVAVRRAMRAAQLMRGRRFAGKQLLRTAIRRFGRGRRDLREEMYRREQKRLARAINRHRAPFVFVPWSFDGTLIAGIKTKTIVVFPDAVTTLFPSRFPGFGWQTLLEGVRLALHHADGIICYSEFVRNVQLPRFLQERERAPRVAVIPQGYFPLPDQSTPKAEAVGRLNLERSRVANLFPQLMAEPVKPEFDAFRYILYPTIDRPHKNTMVIVRALHILLRERYLNVKVVLTTPSLTSDVYNYICRERLHRDVIVMPSVPIDVLNDLFAAASVMVHSSLAEGGDIFNFSRAVSQSCPALLSDIPVVREMFERDDISLKLYEGWLFDPMDPRVLADRIEAVLNEPNDLLLGQQSVLRTLGQYDFAAMARRYYQFCEGFTNGR